LPANEWTDIIDWKSRRGKQIALTSALPRSTEETAERIGINEPALGVQLTSIYQKLHVSNQFELILFAVSHQMVDTCDPTLPCFQKNPRLKNNVWSQSPL
jgi:DNA-binding CsgD family transcriptional regulator